MNSELNEASITLSVPTKREEKGTWYFNITITRIYDNKPIHEIEKRYTNFVELHLALN